MEEEKSPTKSDVMLAKTVLASLSLFNGIACGLLLFVIFMNLPIVLEYAREDVLKITGMPYDSSEIFQSLRFLSRASMAFYIEHDRMPEGLKELKDNYNLKLPKSFKEQYYGIDAEKPCVYCFSDRNKYRYDLRENISFIDILKIASYAANYFINNGRRPDNVIAMKSIMDVKHYSFFSDVYNIDPKTKVLSVFNTFFRIEARSALKFNFDKAQQ